MLSAVGTSAIAYHHNYVARGDDPIRDSVLEGMTPEDELAYLLERAEAGHPTFQYLVSQRICLCDNCLNRRVQAMTWVMIARTLDEASGP